MLKNQKGITLVALVVTIVVLIILATISINLAMNTGIIEKANDAKAWQANADVAFNEMEVNTTALIQGYIDSAAATK